MLRKIIQYFFLSLVLILVFLSSALLAMRFAIQGREVRVPRLTGITPAEAERIANSNGLVLSVESRFYNATVPEGRIVSQSPEQNSTVRRGWKIRVAESLGPQARSRAKPDWTERACGGNQHQPAQPGDWNDGHHPPTRCDCRNRGGTESAAGSY